MRNNLKITAFKRVNGDKFQTRFEQYITKDDTSGINVLALMNEGDNRFKSKPTTALPCYTALAINKQFNVDLLELESLAVGEVLEIEIDNPTIMDYELNIQVVETLIPANDARIGYAKKLVDKETGEQTYFAVDDLFVYRSATVVAGEPKHKFVKDAVKVPAPVASKITSSEGLAVL